MGKSYQQLTADERNFIQRGLNEGLKSSEIARRMGRNRSTNGLIREYLPKGMDLSDVSQRH